mgnify:CR=1 FL=1
MTQGQIEVEIDVLSGRPNPHWWLTAAQAQEVAATLQQQRLEPRAAPPSRLGYRGFVLYQVSAVGQRRPWLRVGLGAITDLTQTPPRSYHDRITLEKRLGDWAKGAGFADLLAQLKQ